LKEKLWLISYWGNKAEKKLSKRKGNYENK